ncbi:MAG: hypothetical protein H0V33_06025 [Acidimicrobiia bacterium]|nr:hypothetical protein [Acidimicrobiia bacterium]
MGNDLEPTCGDVTIAGQTAPGAGITLTGRIDGYSVDPAGNIIIRHLRPWPPPLTDEEGAVVDLGSIYDSLQLTTARRLPTHRTRPVPARTRCRPLDRSDRPNLGHEPLQRPHQRIRRRSSGRGGT